MLAEEGGNDEIKFRAEVVGVTLSRFVISQILPKTIQWGQKCYPVSELLLSVCLYATAMASLLFLFEIVKPSIATLF
uniref:Ovule protein n=1 Tax=Heterorhabditis bacteriophora TaxID=37862 RepID=A0A1I7WP20_HETBA